MSKIDINRLLDEPKFQVYETFSDGNKGIRFRIQYIIKYNELIKEISESGYLYNYQLEQIKHRVKNNPYIYFANKEYIDKKGYVTMVVFTSHAFLEEDITNGKY